MSGASGQIYGIRLLEVLRDAPEVETHLLMSPAARITIAQETDWDPRDVEAASGCGLPSGRHRRGAGQRLVSKPPA